MSFLARPAMASLAARAMQRLTALADRRIASSLLGRYPEYPRNTRELTIPTSVGPARAVVYLPDAPSTRPPTPPPARPRSRPCTSTSTAAAMSCRRSHSTTPCAVSSPRKRASRWSTWTTSSLPSTRFPPRPTRRTRSSGGSPGTARSTAGTATGSPVGGQSAGGGLAAAVARQALEARDDTAPSIALQVLHYPPLDLATHARDKRAAIAKPVLRPWMADVFDSAYVPDPRRRADPLVSPAHPSDTADLTGIAPAFVVTAEHDLLRAEGVRYAERLRKAGALLDHYDVPGVDHGYDQKDAETARGVYALIAAHVRRATTPGSGNTPRENQP